MMAIEYSKKISSDCISSRSRMTTATMTTTHHTRPTLAQVQAGIAIRRPISNCPTAQSTRLLMHRSGGTETSRQEVTRLSYLRGLSFHRMATSMSRVKNYPRSCIRIGRKVSSFIVDNSFRTTKKTTTTITSSELPSENSTLPHSPSTLLPATVESSRRVHDQSLPYAFS